MNAPNPQTLVEIPYTLNTGEKLVNETFGPDDISRRKTGALDMRPMPMENGRPLAASFTLEKTASCLSITKPR